jgi:hypothetical protein
VGLELAAADEPRVLVGLEVGHAHDDRLRVEGGGDARDAFAQAADEEVARVFFAYPARDLARVLLALQLRVADERHRVDADVVVDDELKAREPHAVVRELRDREGVVGVADVHHHLRPRPRLLRHRVALDREADAPLVDEALRALGA